MIEEKQNEQIEALRHQKHKLIEWVNRIDEGYRPSVEEQAEIEELENAIKKAAQLESLNQQQQLGFNLSKKDDNQILTKNDLDDVMAHQAKMLEQFQKKKQ